MDDLLAEFLTETNENLAELDVALVRLETAPEDGETLSGIFRLVHTIKGTCGFLGLPRLEKVAHAGENVLSRMREGSLRATPGLVSLVLEALDRIKAIVASLAATGAEPAGEDGGLIAALNRAAEGEAAVPPTVAAVAPAVPEPIMPAPVIEASVIPASVMQAPGADGAGARAMDGEASDMERPIAAVPIAAVPVAAVPVAEVPVAEVPDAPAASDQRRGAETTPREAPIAAPVSGTQTIRVGVDVLDDLMTLVSELVLTRNQLLQLARTQENSTFTVPLQRLSHITSDLQEGVMKTRMQPIGNAWNKLPRVLRDLARDLGKKIDLAMQGAETELDRQILELIKDPLTHMVRNSADHGLEGPAERRAAGKPDAGRITLTAFHEGGHIIIEIADDGRGLPVDRIRAKVLAQGLATEAELGAMTDAQIQRFIFRPGFSTAAAVTAVSGRGVGMDVVRTNIERIGGTIELRSTAGVGTTFTIKIPLTLAIVSALILEAGGERFAIPQTSVAELVRAGIAAGPAPEAASEATEAAAADQAGVIERINETPVLRLRNRLLPLVSLKELLRLDGGTDGSEPPTIVVTQVGAAMLGLIVDRVFDTEEIVVKPVAPILRHVTMFSGNTILGDGSVIMILDPSGIARATGAGIGDSRAVAAAAPTEAAQRSGERSAILLFRAGEAVAPPMAVPLALVARLEEIPHERIEHCGDALATQYRGRLMPLLSLSGTVDPERANHPALVFTDGDRSMGLLVEAIIDVVDDKLHIELGSVRPGLLGTAVIAGRATEVIDTGYWLTRAFGDWFRPDAARGVPPRLLAVEDSDFFRALLVPALAAAGFDVIAAGSAAEALRLRDAGEQFAAVVSDIEMPEMSGFELARILRAGGAWADLPLIALSGRATGADRAAALAAGFTDHVAKFDRDALLATLRRALAAPDPTGAPAADNPPPPDPGPCTSREAVA
ncbi:MAG: chemotaxis protein CheW [Acetobacteraceae bacterium]